MSNMYKRIIELCDSHGVTPYKMCKETGISQGAITDLKNGRRQSLGFPIASKIADYFGINVESLYESDEQTKKDPTDMTDGEVKDELIEILEELKDRPEMRMLFKSARNATAEQIQAIANMIEGFKK